MRNQLAVVRWVQYSALAKLTGSSAQLRRSSTIADWRSESETRTSLGTGNSKVNSYF